MRLKRPSPGGDIDPEWFPEFFDYVSKKLLKGDGKTTTVRNVDGTYFVSALPPKSSDSSEEKTVYFCEVTAVDEEGEYSVKLYEDKTQSSVGTGTLQLCMCHPMDRLEVGDWLLGTETNLTEIVISEGT